MSIVEKIKIIKMSTDDLVSFLDIIEYSAREEDLKLNIEVVREDFPFLINSYWKLLTPRLAKEVIFKTLVFNSAENDIPLKLVENIKAISTHQEIQDLAQTELDRRELKF